MSRTAAYARPGLLASLLIWLFTWPERRHWRRYLLGWALSVSAITAAGGLYLKMAPVKYTSQWTLILPGTGAGASVSLDSIGSASSIVSSPFSSSSLSPKVIYKSLLESGRVRGLAANSLGLTFAAFGMPRIRLIDETALINIEISAPTAEAARAKGMALDAALAQQLDELRHDEIDRRAAAVQDSLKGYRANLQEARSRMLAFQQETGMVASEQFTQLVLTVEQLRRKLADAEGDLAMEEGQVSSLQKQLGLTPELASAALVLQADPTFIQLAREVADATSALADRQSRFGPSHPQVLREMARKTAVEARLLEVARRLAPAMQAEILHRLSLVDSQARASLVESLVRGASELDGKRHQVATLQAQLAGLEAKMREGSRAAAQLDDLHNDHLVAQAVFSSALARVDTNRADIYASYPLVQVLAEPNLPDAPASPRLAFALIGIVLGSGMATAAWTFAWLRQVFAPRPRRSALSTGPLSAPGASGC